MATRKNQQKRTRKPLKVLASVVHDSDTEKALEPCFCANKGVWKAMNSENGLCDTKILRRGLNVQG